MWKHDKYFFEEFYNYLILINLLMVKEHTCKPAAPGSTPVSSIAITTPRPSYSGCFLRKAAASVSFSKVFIF